MQEALSQTAEITALDGVEDEVGKAWDEGDGYTGAIKDVGKVIFDTMGEAIEEVYGDVINMVEVMIAISFMNRMTRKIVLLWILLSLGLLRSSWMGRKGLGFLIFYALTNMGIMWEEQRI